MAPISIKQHPAARDAVAKVDVVIAAWQSIREAVSTADQSLIDDALLAEIRAHGAAQEAVVEFVQWLDTRPKAVTS